MLNLTERMQEVNVLTLEVAKFNSMGFVQNLKIR